MLSKVISPLPSRAKSVINLCWGNKSRVITLLLIIVMLSSCIPGGNQTQASPTSSTQPQMPNCEATDTGFCWPTGKEVVDSNWMADSCSWSGNDNYFKDKYHIGTDILGKEGDDVFAIADGKVFRISSGEDSGWPGIKVGEDNKGVLVKHKLVDGTEFLALYGHVVTSVREGDVLTAGQPFAKIGPYDISKPHLHFGIRPNTSVPQSHWGKMDCPKTEPITDTNGFENPIDWITKNSPFRSNVLGASTTQDAMPTLTPQAIQEKQLILIAESGKGRLLFVEIPSSKILWQIDGWNGPTCVSVTIDGHILVCEHDGVTEIDKDGRVIRALRGIFKSVTDAKSLGNNTILVSDGEQGKVMELDWSGNVTWSISGLHFPFEAVRLSSGDTLIADGTAILKQFDSRGDIAWSTSLSNWASGVKRLPANNIIVAEYQGIELLRESGSVIWSYKSKNRFNSVEQLPDGFFLVSDGSEERVFTLSPDGTTIGWSMTGLSQPLDAVLLPFVLQSPVSSVLSEPPPLARQDYYSVLQWVKYAFANNDISVFEELTASELIQLIYTVNASATLKRLDFLSELSERLPNKPHCEYFMGGSSGLTIRVTASPPWEMKEFCHFTCTPMDPPLSNASVDLGFELKNDGLELNSMIFGDPEDYYSIHPSDVPKVSCDSVSISSTVVSTPISSELPPLNRDDYYSVLQWVKYAMANGDATVFQELISQEINYVNYIEGGDPTSGQEFLAHLTTRIFSNARCDYYSFDQSYSSTQSKQVGRLQIWTSGWSPAWEMDQLCYNGCQQLNPPARSTEVGFFLLDELNGWKLKTVWVNKLSQWQLFSNAQLIDCDTVQILPSISSTSISSNLLPLNRAEYFSVLQWIKYASLYNDVSVFENLIIGNSIQSIDGNGNSETINKVGFLAELSKRLLNKPNCDFFMFEESGRLVIRISNWSPGWGVDGNTIVYLILEMKNNQWVLTSIIYGDYLPSWAQGLERISYDTISLSVGNTEEACVEARPTRLKVGDFAFISFFPDLRQRIRSSYGTENSILELIPVGTAVKILDGPECADNWVWWKVRVLNSGLVGWTAEGDRDAYWLIPCESRDGCGTQ